MSIRETNSNIDVTGRAWIALIVIFVLALLLRSGYAVIVNPPYLGGDVPYYDTMAVDFANSLYGKSYEPVVPDVTMTPFSHLELLRAPLFPLSLGTGYALLGHDLLVGRLINGVFSALTVVIIFFLTNSLFGRKPAYLASLYAAINPTYIFFANSVYPAALFSFLIALTVFFIIRFGLSNKTKLIIIAGFFSGLAILTRPNFVAAIPLIALSILLFEPIKLNRRVIASIVFIIVTLITISVRPIYNYVKYDELAPIGLDGGVVLYLGNNASSTPCSYTHARKVDGFDKALDLKNDSERDKYYRERAIEHIRGHPIKTAKLWATRFLHFFDPRLVYLQPGYEDVNQLFPLSTVVFYIPILIFGFIGVYTFRGKFRLLSPLYVTILSFGIALVVTPIRLRYKIPVEPLALVIAAGAFADIAKNVYRYVKAKYDPRTGI